MNALRGRFAAARAGLGAAWARVPLSARLIAVITVLVAGGLVLAGVTSVALLQRSLVAQIDEKLKTEGIVIAQRQWADFQGYRQTPVASDYYVRVRAAGYDLPWFAETTVDTYGTPRLPELTAAEANELERRPFTVSSSKHDSNWRAIAFSTEWNGSVIVALPLAGTSDTARTMVGVLLLSGAGIVLLGALAAGFAVRRSLKPLAQIEDTAAAIAAGDLSRRVPSLPESTEVGRLAAALNGMLAQIEQAFADRTASEERMRRFVADASHELRTPLATIRGYAELYRMGAITSDDQMSDTMRRIEGSATGMGTLVEDLLLLARLDEGRPVAQAEVDLTVLAADAISDLRALDPERPATLVALDGDEQGPAVVTGDDARLRQVVANLVGNVVRHTPAGTPVEIATGRTDGVGVLEVRDHGPGIDPAHAARVFERFYRVDASRTRESGGTGLGMAIVAAIVGAHHGTVSLCETPGGGTTVRVAIPTGQASSADYHGVSE